MDSVYLTSLTPEGRNHYKSKLWLETGEQLRDPFAMSSSWSNNITLLPDLSWRDVTEYLIDTPSKFTKEALKAYKSLEAYDYFICNHVHDCYYHEVSKDS